MGAIRDVSGNPVVTSDGVKVTTENLNTLTTQQLASIHAVAPTGPPVSTSLPGLDKVFPAPSSSVEQSAAAMSMNPATATTSLPMSNSTEAAGTIMDYVSKYGLLAGGIFAALIIGTVVVRKIIKRKS